MGGKIGTRRVVVRGRGKRLSGLMVLALAGASISVMAVHGTAAQASMVQQRSADFNIPAQSASAALREFSRQAGVQVLFSSDAVAGMRTNALTGRHTHGRALSILLAGTPLEAVRNGARQYSVRIPRNARTTAAVRGGNNVASGRGARSGAQLAANGPTRRSATSAAGAAQGPNNQTAETGTLLAAAIEDEERRRNEVIVVTGTNIRGIAPESSPAQTYDREDIRDSGVSTVEQFIDRLPQNFGGGSNADVLALPNDRTASFNTTDGSSVNLRGLGSGSTLVLVNGRRLAPSGQLGDFVDISIIPLSAVDQIDIVTDGASAIYGADAIAGVVNFRLRDDYDGLETFGRFGTVTEGNLNEYRAGVTLGTNWSSGNALISYEFYDRDNLEAQDRDFSSAQFLPNDLLPQLRRNSLLFSVSQELVEGLSLRGHAIYSQRDTEKLTTRFGPSTFFFDTSSEQYGFSASSELELGNGWSLTASGDYFSVSEFTDSTLAFPTQREQDSDLWSIEMLVSGTVLSLPGGDAKLAAGLSYREETFMLVRSDLNRIEASDNRKASAIYGELFIPIIGPENRTPGFNQLEFSLAGRYDDFNRFGGTFNPKVGAIWSPFDGLRLRATFGTSFNPPNLGDTGDEGGPVVVANLPDPASPTGTSIVIIDQRAPSDLGPEEAVTWTAGFDYNADLGSGIFSIGVTYYNVDFDNRIARSPGGPLAILPNADALADLIIRNPSPSLVADIIAEAQSAAGFLNFSGGTWTMPGDEDVIINNRLRNLASVNTSGLDFDISYRIEHPLGTLNLTLNANYIFEQEQAITSTSPVFDIVDTIFNPADFRLRSGASWNRDGFSASVFVNYVDSYVDNRVTPTIPVDSWTTVDMNLGYEIGERDGQSLLENTRFSLSILNLLNQDPPSIATDSGDFSPTGFDPANASALGRFIAFQITKRW